MLDISNQMSLFSAAYNFSNFVFIHAETFLPAIYML